MLRGINRQSIFEDDIDRRTFLDILKDVKESKGLELYCYVLMDNHVHLLIRTGEETLGASMKRIAVRYALGYNARYERSGHLFQDRFNSEPIESENHLLAAVRYICQNPLKAKLCKTAGEYPWSSYREYLGIDKGITDTKLVLEMFSQLFSEEKQAFYEFMEDRTDDEFIDDDRRRKTDSELKAFMEALSGCKSASSFQALEKEGRDTCLNRFKQEGFSLRQISRVTGVPFGIVRSK